MKKEKIAFAKPKPIKEWVSPTPWKPRQKLSTQTRIISTFTDVLKVSITIVDPERFRLAFEAFEKESIHPRPGYRIFLKALTARVRRQEEIDQKATGITIYTSHSLEKESHRFGDHTLEI